MHAAKLRLLSLTLPLLVLAATVSVPGRRVATADLPSAEEAAPATAHAAEPSSELTSEQCDRLAEVGADRWHAAGVRGHGVKILVLDTGFRGWREHLGKDLPAHVVAHSFRGDHNLEFRDSQHGILCGEVIHTLAPDAELLLANWEPGHEDQYLAAIRWAKELGAHIISVSVITPSWSDGQGGGAMHRALSALLGSGRSAADLLCFASAGNTTDRHWGGHFRDDGHGWHCWQPGQIDNGLRPWGDDEIAVEMYGRPGGTWEMCVSDADTGRQVARATNSPGQTDRLSAAIRFAPESGHSYRLRVRHVSGPAGDFHVTTTFASLDRTTPGANVCFPADGDEVVALGAVDDKGHRQEYSACGTNLPHPKPDLVAEVPFPSSWRARPFGGTSAAAPQAAALAALYWSRHPDWSAAHVRQSLRDAAIDLNTPGPDYETGYGLIHLPADQ